MLFVQALLTKTYESNFMKKLILVIILFTLVITGSFWISATFYQYEVVATELFALKNLKLITENTADKIKFLLYDFCDNTEYIANLVAVNDTSKEYVSSVFKKELKEVKYLSGVYLINNDNSLGISYPLKSEENFFKDRKFLTKYFNLARTTLESYITVYNGSDKKDYSVFYIIAPVIDEHTSIRSEKIVCVAINMFSIKSLLALNNSYGIIGETWITNEGNENITSAKNGDYIDIKSLIAHSYDKNIKSSVNPFLYYYNNEKYLLVSAPITINNHNWKHSILLPYKTITELLYPFYKRILVLIIFIILIITLILLIIINYEKILKTLSKEIRELEIYIDHHKKKSEVEEIVDSDYFKILLEKADKLRKGK